MFRRTDTDTPSPVTTVTTENLDQRGVSTIQDGLQQLASNNGPALTNSFTANGAFAGGASAVSLRGLSTNSTLVLFDGMRAAYYPLADDGSRNFVDLNTIPDDIIDRIEVLRDGASSSYGADAIAGVVNIITKKQFTGIAGRAEAGVSSRGDAPSQRFSLTAGFGDLEEKGINAYVSGFYYNSTALKNSDRPYPYSSDDQSGICFDGSCGPDNRINADVSGGLAARSNFLVRPYTTPALTTAVGPWQSLNTDCIGGALRTVTAAEKANNPSAPNTICTFDQTKTYGYITPNVQRWGVSGRVTAKLNDSIEAYAEVNFMQSKSSYQGLPEAVSRNANTGILYRRFSTSSASAINAPGSFVLYLPVYVCPERTNCAASPNRKLNPNNPFAAQGQVARILGADLNHVEYNETRNRAYRGAMGISGDLSDKITFDVGVTAMHTDLRRTQNGYIHIQHMLDVINDGTYNFVNPSATPDSVLSYLYPNNVHTATSDEVQFQATLGTTLAQLPGGPLQLGGGGSITYEAVDAPSANDDYNGPTQRYFVLNAFGTTGHRTVYSGFAELEAPVLENLVINASGRYDKYSSGQHAFSPKIGFKFTPIRQFEIRGTYSKGFRIPSFGEANALPTTGFVSNTAAAFNNAYLAQYTVPGNTAGAGGTFAQCTVATFSTAACPTYIRSGSYGQTQLASPNLDPEKSRSFTAGIRFEPMRNLSLTVDYYNIKKTGGITSPSNAPALVAYYAGAAIPGIYTVIPDAPDPAFPNAKPRVAFVQASLINADEIRSEGLDFGLEAKLDLTDHITWETSLDASYILKLSTNDERYDGTLGNFNLTAGSGTPKWHGSWLNSLSFNDRFQFNTTVNYFGGYNLSAMDQGTGYKDCGLSGGFTPCDVPKYITIDLGARVKINDHFTFYAIMNNAFDKMPPIDAVTYGANNYNPVQGGNGILGRYFKAGVKVGF
ncbi:MAG: TonB-dependent receptor [Sphingomonadales bacterium]|nr:TonB-dependent receptor [Sphingomonadales bacterium]